MDFRLNTNQQGIFTNAIESAANGVKAVMRAIYTLIAARVTKCDTDHVIVTSSVAPTTPVEITAPGIDDALNVLAQLVAKGTFVDPTTGRIRVMIESTVSTPVTGSLTTVTNLTNVGTIPADYGINAPLQDSAWADCVRSKIN